MKDGMDTVGAAGMFCPLGQTQEGLIWFNHLFPLDPMDLCSHCAHNFLFSLNETQSTIPYFSRCIERTFTGVCSFGGTSQDNPKKFGFPIKGHVFSLKTLLEKKKITIPKWLGSHPFPENLAGKRK